MSRESRGQNDLLSKDHQNVSEQKKKLFTHDQLVKLILPLIFEQLLAVLVGFVDTLMVSWSGEAAVAGVALDDNINRLILLVLSALATGGAVVCSQYIGKGEPSQSRKASAQLETVLAGISTILTVFALLTCRPLLSGIFGNVEPDVMECAVTYFVITAWSYPFVGLYNAGAAIFRSVGNSKVSMLIGLLMNTLNVIFNAIFVFGMHMSVAGVALATVISRVVGAVLITALACTHYNPNPLNHIHDFIPDMQIIGKILYIGIPSGLENGIFQIGKLVLVRMITGFGTAATAANSIAFSIVDFPNIPGAAMGLALITVVGQCVGAGEKEQATYYTKKILRTAYKGIWGTDILLILFAPVIVTFFHLSQEAMDMSVVILRLFGMVSIFIWPMSFTLPNALRAAGDVMYTMVVSVASMWAIRVGLAYVLGVMLGFGLTGVWVAMFLDWACRTAFFGYHFYSGKWLEAKKMV